MSQGACPTVKVKTDNEQGFYICNADSVPEGAELFDAEPKKKRGPKAKAD